MKVLKSLTVILLLMILAFSLAGCKEKTAVTEPEIMPEQEMPREETEPVELDYDGMINSFVPNENNTVSLSVGDTHLPDASIWLENGDGSVYTSNEAVVTVADDGIVTAVGEGHAYIIVGGQKNSVSTIYRYDVEMSIPEADLSNLPEIDGIDFKSEIEKFVSDHINTFELKVGEAHTPSAAVWAKDGACYSSDSTVVTVSEAGDVSTTGIGTAYVLIKSNAGELFKIYKYVVSE